MRTSAFAFVIPALAALGALAATAAPSAQAESPVAVELFTSQSCSSCPPAEALQRAFADDPHIVALEWHVDYWDSLRAGDAGRWKDPFSSSAHTERQRLYNRRIRGNSEVYTPQTVINGETEAVGSDRDAIGRLIRRGEADKARTHIVAVGGAKVSFRIEGAPADAEAVLVRFKKRTGNAVNGGENRGRNLASANVVISSAVLGSPIDGKPITADAPAAGEGCALLVQGRGVGRILAAAYCPA